MVSGRLPLAELKRHEMTDALTKGSLDMPLIVDVSMDWWEQRNP